MLAILIGAGVLLFFAYEVYGAKLMTQPTTDFTSALANAIAKAEGTSPSANNPGSLTAGDVPSESIIGEFNSAGVVLIDTIENGWNYLNAKLRNILSGNSSVYSPSMTISEFAQKYTGGDNAEGWANTVSSQLGVTPDTTLAEAEAQFNGG